MIENKNRQDEYSKIDLAEIIDEVLQGKVRPELQDKLINLLSAAGELLGELKPDDIPGSPDKDIIDNKGIYHTIQVILSRVIKDPQSLATHYGAFASSVIEVLKRKSNVQADPGDRRFKDNMWRESPFYNGLVQIYLSWEAHMQAWANEQKLDDNDKRRFEFIINQLIAALAPSNLPINPGGLKRAEKSNGKTAVAGIKNWIQDVVSNQSMPRQINNSAYTLGVDLATTPGDVIYRNELLELIQYTPQTKQVRRRPVLLLPAQINKYYVFDLKPRNSMLNYLVQQGLQVFAISWRNPTSEHSDWGLETYIKAVLESIEVMRAITCNRSINIISACAGGFTAAAMLGYLAETKNHLIHSHSSFVTTTSPRSKSILELLVTRNSIELGRKISLKAGTMSGKDLAQIFAWLRPNDLVWNYWVNNYIMGRQPPPLDVLYWDADSTRLSAKLHSDFIDFYMADVNNNPGQHQLFGIDIDYSKIRVNTYFLAGQDDYLMPWKNIYSDARQLKGKHRFVLVPGGHVKSLLRPLYLPQSEYFVNESFPESPDDWLNGATTYQGSWWQDWVRWLHENSGSYKKAPVQNGNRDFRPIISAPGNYVRVRM